MVTTYSSVLSCAVFEGAICRVLFAGAVPHDDLWAYYADADVFVLLSRSEALGLVVWEAFATGVPAIVSDTEGLRESAGEHGERAFVWDERMGAGVFRGYVDMCIEDGATVQAMCVNSSAYVSAKMHSCDTVLAQLFCSKNL